MSELSSPPITLAVLDLSHVANNPSQPHAHAAVDSDKRAMEENK
jgi:hypothetical protein